jgi:hypothetical protein
VVYVNCNEDTILHGERLSSIVGYAIKAIGIINSSMYNKEHYDNCCEALEKKLGSHEPRGKSIELVDCDNNTFVKQISKFLSQCMGQFDRLIENAIEMFMSGNTFMCSEFRMLKIFKSGEMLEFIPGYMEIRVNRKKQNFFASGKENEVSLNYQEKKFILSKFDIFKIIDKAPAEAEEKW